MNNPLQGDREGQTLEADLRQRIRDLEAEVAAIKRADLRSNVDSLTALESFPAAQRTIEGDGKQTDPSSDRETIRNVDAVSGVGAWDWNLITNEVAWSPQLYKVLGVPEEVSPSLAYWEQLVHPEDKERAFKEVFSALADQNVVELEFRIVSPAGGVRWISSLGRIFRDETGRAVQISGLNIDLTARKQGEQRAAFLLTLEDETRPLTDSREIVQTVARLLGQHLKVNRCAYADVEEDENTFNLTGDFTDGVSSIVGRYTFAQFGAECLRLMRSGQPYVVEDSEADVRTESVRDAYRQTSIRSVICVPLHKRGRFAAAMAVHAVVPRKWHPNEIELMQVVTNRCWESLERTRAEVEVRSQWHTFDTLLSNVPDQMCIFDVEGRFTYVNAALLEVWRKSLPDVIGKNTFELGYPVDLASRLQHEVKQVVRTACPVRNHTPFTSVSGETRTYEYILSPVLSWRGLVEAVTCSSRDVTDRDRMERVLADSQERLQQVFRQAPVSIMVCRGRDLVIELANPPFEAMVQRRSLAGLPLAAAIPGLGRQVPDAFRRVLDTGEPFIANDCLISFDQDGDGRPEEHWYDVMYHPLRESNDEISGVVAVFSDVTTQAVVRKELEKANRELEEFAYVASHDLQEPLRMVGIYTQILLLRFLPDDPQATEFGGYVKQGVQRMEQLIQDLLSYSRTIHTDGTDVGVADLNECFARALGTMQNRIMESAARVIVSTLPVVRGDVTQWTLVFQNLLSNSLKYHRPEVAPVVEVSAAQDGESWLITVRDNGIGFEQQYAERIFMLFKRLHKDEYPGTGLGLAICQRVVERFGGRIWAEGSQGSGATFFIVVPEA